MTNAYKRYSKTYRDELDKMIAAAKDLQSNKVAGIDLNKTLFESFDTMEQASETYHKEFAKEYAEKKRAV